MTSLLERGLDSLKLAFGGRHTRVTLEPTGATPGLTLETPSLTINVQPYGDPSQLPAGLRIEGSAWHRDETITVSLGT